MVETLYPRFRDNPNTNPIVAGLPSVIHALGSYSQTKTIYTIDRALVANLADCKLPDAIPMEALFLPKNGMVLDIPLHPAMDSGDVLDARVSRIQVFCTYDENYETKGLDLNLNAFAVVPGKGFSPVSKLWACLDTTAPTLQESVERLAAYLSRCHGASKAETEFYRQNKDVIQQKMRETLHQKALKLILSLILYINGNDDLVEVFSEKKEVMNRAKRRRLAKAGPVVEEPGPKVFKVGSKFASVIQRWEDQERQDAAGTGRPIRPHLRAAHAHLYRVGKGRLGTRVKFLPPIPVKGWEAPESEAKQRLVR
jgi:hypothetical protein